MFQSTVARLRAGVAAAVLGAAALVPIAAAPAAHADTGHVADPYAGAAPYLNPDYTAEVTAQADADGGALGAAEKQVAGYQTAIWMDHIGAIAGDDGRLGLKAQLDNAEAQAATSSQPVLVEVVVYDLPGRDCAALASNGELPATAAGLSSYESDYIDPIASILGDSAYGNLRISTIVEPDSLPNAVTNTSKPACATAAPLYEQGVQYALNALHAIPNVYTYLDAGHAGWLGWPTNMAAAAQEFAKVVSSTTAGYASVDGFISDTANYTPVQEPFLTDPTLTIGGNQMESAGFYQYNPMFDEYDYDNAMYAALGQAGFPGRIGFLIDTSRDGWGGPGRPTGLDSGPTTVDAYVTANKIDQRPFRGDWCNIDGAGLGAPPQAQPYGADSHIIAFVWIKPPGESDGDYPSGTHTHGDPHCDPAGTQADGTTTYPTDSLPGYDIPAGQWFGAEFQQLVENAYPAVGATGTVRIRDAAGNTSAASTAPTVTTDPSGGADSSS